jgi:hypothetical protein
MRTIFRREMRSYEFWNLFTVFRAVAVRGNGIECAKQDYSDYVTAMYFSYCRLSCSSQALSIETFIQLTEEGNLYQLTFDSLNLPLFHPIWMLPDSWWIKTHMAIT